MIKIEEHRLFKRYYRKLSTKQKTLYKQRVLILEKNPRHTLLKMHSLHGILEGCYAFSLSGDLRVVFQWVNKNHIVLIKIGTHNQVY